MPEMPRLDVAKATEEYCQQADWRPANLPGAWRFAEFMTQAQRGLLEVIDCPACDGTGEIPVGEMLFTCDTCLGNGKIARWERGKE